MAYSNEQSVELKRIQKNNRGDYLVISKITSKTGNVSVDIRQYYTDDNDEVLPTKKGVRFNAESLMDIVVALSGALEDDEKIELAEMLSEEDDEEEEDNEEEDEDYGY